MKHDISEHTREQFEEALQQILGDLLKPKKVSCTRFPKAVLLGGQSGAGKTALHTICDTRFSSNAIVINGDSYRSSHPRFYELDEKYGPDAVNYTAVWAGAMTEALIDELSRVGYNLVIEGTLRTAEVPIKTATLLRERGYDVSLALMAVKPEISLISCQIRYEEMRIAGTVPRATDPEHHNKIIRQIVSNLEVLERSALFDGIELYSRSRERLFPAESFHRSASQALEDILFGSWTEEETSHYEYLKEKLRRLKAAKS